MDFKIRNANDLKRLMDYIEKQAEDSLRLVALEVETMMKDYIMSTLYKSKPEEYWRTYDFVNSLTVKKVYRNNKGEIETEVYFDPNKIRSMEVVDSIWNQHMSVNGSTMWEGRPISEWIPIFLDKGTTKGLYPRPGINVIGTMLQKLDNDKQFKKMMEEELRKKGFKIE